MKIIAQLLCLFVTTITLAQKPAAKAAPSSQNEWDQLDKVFISLINALTKNDQSAFKALSLPAVDCIDCVGKPEFNAEGYFVTADVFYLNIANNFVGSPVYKAMAKRGYTFGSIVLKDFKPKIMPRDYPKDLKLYEVWVPTYLANELSKGNPGASHAFQFVKINGKFKFYGLTSIP